MSKYPTKLTEKQWQVIKNIVEPQERNRKSSLRDSISTKADGRGECSPHTLLLGKRFITISKNRSLKEFVKNC